MDVKELKKLADTLDDKGKQELIFFFAIPNHWCFNQIFSTLFGLVSLYRQQGI
jgi:hypothetical protein